MDFVKEDLESNISCEGKEEKIISNIILNPSKKEKISKNNEIIPTISINKQSNNLNNNDNENTNNISVIEDKKGIESVNSNKENISKTQNETKIKIVIVNDKNSENKETGKNDHNDKTDDSSKENKLNKISKDNKTEKDELLPKDLGKEESNKENDQTNLNISSNDDIKSEINDELTVTTSIDSPIKKLSDSVVINNTENTIDAMDIENSLSTNVTNNSNITTTNTKNSTNKRDKRKKKNVNDSLLKVNEERKKRIKLVVKVIDEVPLEKFIETLGVNLDFNNTIDNNYSKNDGMKSVGKDVPEKQKLGSEKEFVFDVMKFDSNIMKKLNDLVK
jgi:hypothetical protein